LQRGVDIVGRKKRRRKRVEKRKGLEDKREK